MLSSSIAVAAFFLASNALAFQPWHGWHRHQLPGHRLPPSPGIHEASFDQLIDHRNPSLGTFPQRYWYSTEFWAGQGSPVVMMTPGEISAAGYTGFTGNETITGMIAQRIGAATIVLEHRYWGTSSPSTELTTANMQYLTLDNNIGDLTHFAKTVKLPFAGGIRSNAESVPWINVGGSYPGALAAYVESLSPGTFWASLASSAPVQVISDFWEYFEPVQMGMPANCSADVARVIDHLDDIMMHGTQDEINEIKTKFGLAGVEHNDDFMSALQNGPWSWQSNSANSDAAFMTWCNYIENAVNSSAPLPGSEGVGLERALDGYAAWMKEVQTPGYCASFGYFQGDDNIDCYNTYDASNPMYTDVSLNNTVNRSWMWVLCNEPFGFWQTGAPTDRPSIVSRLVTPEYFIRQCPLYFPTGPQGQTFGIARGANEDQVNARTGGWNINERPLRRIIFTNGEFDPWRPGSLSSTFRPGGPVGDSDQIKVNVIAGGVHCYDFTADGGVASSSVAAVQKREIDQIEAWVKEYPRQHHGGDGWGGGWGSTGREFTA